MADSVYYHLERMLPELDDLQQRGLFSKAEIKEIARRRRDFEFCLERRSKLKEDYLRYVEYETQLEALRKLRKKAFVRELNASKRRWQNSLCDRASAMRIMLIYERAVTRFKGDLDLWLRYLEYCRSQGTRRMQKVLTKALQLHSTVPGLWIYAAAWEFEHNVNVAAARALMQRGLRMCPHAENLWLEYFRMELVYAQRLKASKLLSGLDSAAPRVYESGVSEEKENLEVAVGTGKGGQMHLNGNSVSEMEEIGKRHLNEDELGYKLARAIFRNAIATIPSSSTFRQRFIEVLKDADFEQASILEDEILSGLEKDFPVDEGCWDWQARIHVERAEKSGNLSAAIAREKAVQVYENALNNVPSALMFELYAKFLEDHLDANGHKPQADLSSSEKDSDRGPEVATALLQIYERAEKSRVVSTVLAEGHTSLLLKWGKLESARELLSRLCSGDLKACARLWALRISLEMKSQLISEADLRRIADLCQQGLKQIPVTEAKAIWHMVMEFFAGETTFYDHVVQMLEAEITGCGGGQIGAELACSLIDWILYNQNIDQARKAYNRILGLPGPSLEFYKHCISIESRMFAMGCTEALQHMRTLFKSAVDMYGQDTGLWLEYCSQEIKAGSLEAASAVYWRARKTLHNPSHFIESHQHLVT